MALKRAKNFFNMFKHQFKESFNHGFAYAQHKVAKKQAYKAYMKRTKPVVPYYPVKKSIRPAVYVGTGAGVVTALGVVDSYKRKKRRK